MVTKPIKLCSTSKELSKQDNFGITKLNTIFSFGLNMDASFKGGKNAYLHVTNNPGGKPIYSLFNFSASRHSRTKHIISQADIINNSPHVTASNVNFDIFNAHQWIQNIIDIANSSPNFIHPMRMNVFKLNKVYLKQLFIYLACQIKDNENLYKHPKHQYI